MFNDRTVMSAACVIRACNLNGIIQEEGSKLTEIASASIIALFRYLRAEQLCINA
jgi:hypothetical protein